MLIIAISVRGGGGAVVAPKTVLEEERSQQKFRGNFGEIWGNFGEISKRRKR